MLVVHVKNFKRRFVAAAAGAAALAAVILLLAGCLGRDKTGEPQTIPAATNEERVAWLKQLGWDVAAQPLETLALQLPEDLAQSHSDYIALQEALGLPFADYGGKTVSRYTYTVNNYPDYAGTVQADLYICDGQIIGGDIIASGENGFVRDLRFPG